MRKMGLVDQLQLSFPMKKDTFVQRLKQITEDGEIDPFSEMFDGWTSSNKEFKGRINEDGFCIKKRKKLFERRMSSVNATGLFSELNSQLKIDVEIGVGGFTSWWSLLLLIPFVFGYTVFAILFITAGLYMVILIQTAFMIAITYFMVKMGVKRLKYELEREFFHLTKI